MTCSGYNRHMRTHRVLHIVIICLCFSSVTIVSASTATEVEQFSEIFQEGIASWYTSEVDGALTANGEVFDPELLNAAHKDLRFGTIVRVKNLTNDMTVDVRINDRGPYVEGRIIDLTPAAARQIDMYEKGIVPVTLTILYYPDIPESRYDRPGDTGWYRLQVGSYRDYDKALSAFLKLYDHAFSVMTELLENGLIRISVRWIEASNLVQTMQKLESLGFSEILKRSETAP